MDQQEATMEQQGLPPTDKKCSVCLITKHHSNFDNYVKNGIYKFRYNCKDCRKKLNAEYYQKTKEGRKYGRDHKTCGCLKKDKCPCNPHDPDNM